MKVYLLKIERGVYEAPLHLQLYESSKAHEPVRRDRTEFNGRSRGRKEIKGLPLDYPWRTTFATYMLRVAHNQPLVQHPRLCVDIPTRLNYRSFNVIESENGTAPTVPFSKLK